MEHTNLCGLYRELDMILERELMAAVKAHGGEYIFIHLNENDEDEIDELERDNAPVVLAVRKWCDDIEHYRISRVKVNIVDGIDNLVVFGWPFDSFYPDEDVISGFARGQLESILDAIPETEAVKSVAGATNQKPTVFVNVGLPQTTKKKRITDNQYSVCVALGEDTVKAVLNENMAEVESMLADKYSFKVRSFDTPEAARAYVQGIDDASGYLEISILSPSNSFELKIIKKLQNGTGI